MRCFKDCDRRIFAKDGEELDFNGCSVPAKLPDSEGRATETDFPYNQKIHGYSPLFQPVELLRFLGVASEDEKEVNNPWRRVFGFCD